MTPVGPRLFVLSQYKYISPVATSHGVNPVLSVRIKVLGEDYTMRAFNSSNAMADERTKRPSFARKGGFGLSIDVPKEETGNENPSRKYNLTRSGTFEKGELQINALGIKGGLLTRKTTMGVDVKMEDLSAPIETLGSGASGIVQKVLHTPTEKLLALKIINVFDESRQNQIIKELKTYYDCSSPHIVEFFGAFYQDGQISIALELMESSLADVQKALGRIPEEMLAPIARQVLLGLKYLRQRHIVHRDIKPSNLLINAAGLVKITDFGTSAQLEDTYADASTFVGTMCYMSPERLEGSQYSYGIDIWSLGMSILQCLMGRLPFPVDSATQFWELLNLMKALDVRMVVKATIEDDLSTLSLNDSAPAQKATSSNGVEASADLVDFLAHCLERTPDKRWNPEQLLEHPWIKGCASDEHLDEDAGTYSPPTKLRDWAVKALDEVNIWHASKQERRMSALDAISDEF